MASCATRRDAKGRARSKQAGVAPEVARSTLYNKYPKHAWLKVRRSSRCAGGTGNFADVMIFQNKVVEKKDLMANVMLPPSVVGCHQQVVSGTLLVITDSESSLARSMLSSSPP